MSTSLRIWASALFLTGLSSVAAAEPVAVIGGKFAPRDECTALPGGGAFRSALADAVRRQDVEALIALAAPDVKLDFGGGEGRAELRQRLIGTQGPGLWRELTGLLTLGCAIDDGEMVLPWLFAQAIDSEDSSALMLVTGERVPLLLQADAAAPPGAWLSWAVVEPAEGYDKTAEIRPVRVIDTDVEGFVAAAKLRSVIGYRLIAARSGGAWKIKAFLAGD